MKKQPSVRKQRRIDGALERQALRDKRSAEDQLRLLDQKLGVNQGAKKERERLMNVLIKEAALEPNTPLDKIASPRLRAYIEERRAERGEV